MPLTALRARLGRLARSFACGGIATAVDLGVLMFLVAACRLDPRAASWPALAVGAVVAFFGNRHLVFRADAQSLPRQLAGYLAVEAGALVLNGVLYHATLTLLPIPHGAYATVRLVTGNVVYLGYSYPLWHWVFRGENLGIVPVR